MADPRILIVDDEESMCQYLSILLEKDGYDVTAVQTGVEALGEMEREPFDVVISDIQMPKLNGIQLLKGIKAIDPDTPVIMLTAYASEQSAIEAVNLGAYSYLQKHCKNDEIKVAVRNAAALRRAKSENVQLKRELTTKRAKQKIIGQSAGMRAVYKMIDKIAATSATILITGESGTGKELIAKTIHERSERADKPFVAINCGAIPETLLESQLFGHVKGSFTGADRDHDGFCRQAEGGTIFLDEIGELTLQLQVKLLRAVQERVFKRVGGTKDIEVDIRIVSATNKNLDEEVIEGNFREDLFYRLNVIELKVPPLRERKPDIPLLAQHFLEKYSSEMGKEVVKLSSYAAEMLANYSFPGNIRELENLIERSVALSTTNIILPESLSISIHKRRRWVEGVKGKRFDLLEVEKGVSLDEILADFEAAYLEKALEFSGDNKNKAAELLGITLRSLRYRLGKLGISKAEP
jgi:two-component system response regulator PilR (NtrC family)